jgi:hypothetical protein
MGRARANEGSAVRSWVRPTGWQRAASRRTGTCTRNRKAAELPTEPDRPVWTSVQQDAMNKVIIARCARCRAGRRVSSRLLAVQRELHYDDA